MNLNRFFILLVLIIQLSGCSSTFQKSVLELDGTEKGKIVSAVCTPPIIKVIVTPSIPLTFDNDGGYIDINDKRVKGTLISGESVNLHLYDISFIVIGYTTGQTVTVDYRQAINYCAIRAGNDFDKYNTEKNRFFEEIKFNRQGAVIDTALMRLQGKNLQQRHVDIALNRIFTTKYKYRNWYKTARTILTPAGAAFMYIEGKEIL